MMESLLAFKRAGAAGILTYFAPRAAALLNEARWNARMTERPATLLAGLCAIVSLPRQGGSGQPAASDRAGDFSSVSSSVPSLSGLACGKELSRSARRTRSYRACRRLSGSAALRSVPRRPAKLLGVERAVSVVGVELLEHRGAGGLTPRARSTVPSASGSSTFISAASTAAIGSRRTGKEQRWRRSSRPSARIILGIIGNLRSHFSRYREPEILLGVHPVPQRDRMTG